MTMANEGASGVASLGSWRAASLLWSGWSATLRGNGPSARPWRKVFLLGAWLLAVTLLTWAPPGRAAETYGPIRAGETLWGIAGRLQPGTGLNRAQVMLGLLNANPDAFAVPCNVSSRLAVGAVLRVPDAGQMAEPDARAADAEIAEQGRVWRAHRGRGERLECPAAPAPTPPPAQQTGPAPDAGGGSGTATPLPEEPAAAPQARLPAAGPIAPPADPAGPAAAATPAAPCPPAVPAALPAPGHPRPLLAGEHPGHVDPGGRAPVWLLVLLTLALVTAAMARWEHRRALAAALSSPTAALAAVAALPRRVLTLLAPTGREARLLLPLAALAGVLGALVTVLFREGIHGLEWLLGSQGRGLIETSLALPHWQRLLLPAAGGLVAGLVLQEIGQRLKGLRTTDYMEAIAQGDGRIGVRQSLVKGVSSLCTVASGGSIGREGAMVQLSAMVASALGRIGRFAPGTLRILVAAGAAAGLASAYNAPLAATIFVAEIVLGSIAIDYIGPLIVAAVIANVTVHDLLGYAPVYVIPEFHIVTDWELGFYLILGILAGHTAPVFLALLERSHRWFASLPVPLAARLGLGGLIVGAISVYEPQVWGNGYGVVNSVLQDPWGWQALATVLVLKMLATAATHGSGAVGGAFTPTLFVGAMLGALFGTLVHLLLPGITAPPAAYAVVGMGAMLAGTTQAPLMSILMVFEMTMDYQIVLPLMLAVIIGQYSSRRYGGIRPMYAESLLPRA